jgi:S1-C subfamily serine protease
MATPYILMTQEYNRLEADINNLKGQVSNILAQKLDAEMRQKMNNEFKNLNALSNELSRNGMRGIRAQYNTILQRINTEIVNYSNRVAAAEEEAAKKAAEERARVEAELNAPKEWGGTGFALKDGYVVTNYHVVEDAASILIKGVKGNFSEEHRAEIVAVDKYNDLALLKIVSPSFTGLGSIPYNVKTTMADVGEDIFVLGYPLTSTMGDEIKLTTGVVSSKTGFQGDVSLYQISAPVQPGNSGGPLFDSKGNVIGVVSSKHQGAENVGYAIKTSYLRNLLESYISTSILPVSNHITSLSLTEKVKSLRNFIFMIKCKSEDNTINVDIVNPEVYMMPNDNKGLKIRRVRITPTQTILDFEYDNSVNKSGWITISPQTYIYIPDLGKKYEMTRAEGIPVEPNKYHFKYVNEKRTFRLYFPPLPKATSSFNLIESAESSWKFYGVKIKR